MSKHANRGRFVTFSSLLSIAFGATGLAGCFFHLQILRTIVPGLVAITANTSLCLILLGLSLWCLREQAGTSTMPLTKALGRTAAIIAGVVGLLSLTEFLGNLDFSIDQLLFTETALGTLGHIRPGLMSPVTALNFVLLGLALLLLDWITRRHTWPAQVLCFIAGIIAVFTFVDLIVNPHLSRAHIALPTITVLTIFPFAVICARPKRAFGGLLLASTPRKILLSQFFSPSALLARQRGGPLHYMLAVVLVAAGAVLRHWLVGYIPQGQIFITYFPAVMISALLGGLGPGILATMLSAACANYFSLSPVGVFKISNRDELLSLLMFFCGGWALTWLASVIERTREEAAVALRQSESDLRQAQHVAHIGAWKWDTVSNTSLWSPEMYAIFGRDPQLPPLGYQEHLQFTTPEGAALEDAAVKTCLQTGRAYEFDLEIVLRDGTRKWVVNRGTPDRDAQGRITGLRGTVQDITERKQAEAKLQYMNDVIEHTEQPFVSVDPDGSIVTFNQAYEKLTGYSRDELLKLTYQDLTPSRWHEMEARIIAESLASGIPSPRYEKQYRRKDGTLVPIELLAEMHHDRRGKVWRMSAFITDLTERKRTEAAISAERQKFNTILDSVPSYVCLLTPDYRVAFANREFRTRFGEHQGRKCYEFLFNRTEPCEVCETFKVLTDDQRRSWQWTGPDGCHYDIFDFPFSDTDGSKLILEMGIDVTAREKARTALEDERKRFESMLDSLPAMICLLTPDYQVAFANQAFRKQFGEANGRKCHEYCYGKTSPCDFCESFQVLETKAAHDWEVTTNDGRLIHAFDFPFSDTDGSPLVLEMNVDITEQRAAEKKLREQAALLELALDAIFVRDLDSRLVYWNRGAADLYGWSREEAIGKISHALLKTEFPEPLQNIETAIYELGSWEGELTHVTRNGIRVVTASRWSLLRDEEGNPSAVLEINRDITERKAAEQARRAVEANLAALVESTGDLVWSVDVNYDLITFNRALQEHIQKSYGIQVEAGMSPDKLLPSERAPSWAPMYARALSDGAYRLEYALIDGRTMDLSFNPIVQDGRKTGVSVFAKDVTERKRAEQALRESEANFRTLANFVPQFVWMCKPDGLNIYFNHRWVEYTGLSLEQSYGRGWNTPFHPDDKQAAWDAWNRAAGTGETYRVESRLRAADGSYRWFLMRGVPLRDEAENIVKWFGTCTDIDDMKVAEAELSRLNQDLEKRVQERTAQLRESEQQVRRKLDSILQPEGDLGDLQLADILDMPAIQSLLEDFHSVVHVTTALIDLQGNILAVVGWQNICMQFHRVHPECGKFCVESDRELSAGIPEGEFRIYKCKNHMWDVATPIIVGGKHLGNLFCGQFFFDDETVDSELFRAQARQYGFKETDYLAALAAVPRLSREEVNASMTFLAKLARMISQLSYSSIKLARSSTQIGRANQELAASVKELEAFTYSVSHDLRAPLRHISGFSKILSEEFGPNLPADAQHHLQRIQQGTQRMGLLVDDLLNLARVGRRDLTLQVTGLKSIAEEVIAELASEWQERQIQWRIGDLPFVECDPGLIKQVLQNLISNAIKFTRPRPQAIIEVGQMDKQGAITVFVRDNGVGFAMKYSDKLFGVFQRLHRLEDFEGTGVGLATVQRIIQKHGGLIWAEAELDKGATFYFTLGHSEKTEIKTHAATAGDIT